MHILNAALGTIILWACLKALYTGEVLGFHIRTKAKIYYRESESLIFYIYVSAYILAAASLLLSAYIELS